MSMLNRLTCQEVDELAGLYALNVLEPDEEAAVREHLAAHPDAHQAFALVGGAAAALATVIEPVEPPEQLRSKVLAAIAATPQVASASDAKATTRGQAQPERAAEPARPVMPAPRRAEPISLAAERERRASRFRNVWQPVLAAAAVLLIVALGATTFLSMRDASEAQGRANLMRQALAVSLDSSSQVAALRGSGSAAAATGFAAFRSDGTGFIVLQGLPQVPSDKVYEAWYISGQTPYRAVLMSIGSDGLAIASGLTMQQGTSVVALTVEPQGGTDAPTSAPIVVGTMQQGPLAGVFSIMALTPGGARGL